MYIRFKIRALSFRDMLGEMDHQEKLAFIQIMDENRGRSIQGRARQWLRSGLRCDKLCFCDFLIEAILD
eukprot:1161417-Pelagomonas_calceolata.AAC.1